MKNILHYTLLLSFVLEIKYNPITKQTIQR